jgi:hypothetical protein
MQKETLIVDAFIAPQMFDARTQEIARSSNHSMNRVSLFEEQFGQVRAILASDAGDQSGFGVPVHRLPVGSAPINEGWRSHKENPGICRGVLVPGDLFPKSLPEALFVPDRFPGKLRASP